MKFVALAVALFLAVGCQAASLQADAPSQLAHARATANVFVEQVKTSIRNALEQLDDAEYAELKQRINVRLESFHDSLKALQKNVGPVTDSIATTIDDATSELRTNIFNDIRSVQDKITPHLEPLQNTLKAHLAEYPGLVAPIVEEYSNSYKAMVADLKPKVEPLMEKLRTEVRTNWEETQDKLLPVVEAVRTKVYQRVEELKEQVKPYMEEVQEQAKQMYEQAQTFNGQELTERLTPLFENLKVNLQAIFQAVADTVNKN